MKEKDRRNVKKHKRKKSMVYHPRALKTTNIKAYDFISNTVSKFKNVCTY